MKAKQLIIFVEIVAFCWENKKQNKQTKTNKLRGP
jgi:hypothetical protein